ncbi:MAG: Mu-like prophage major head subunit gpT family protein [Candidatus Peribacteraceae bacterium]|nr:Mu-like prophage major head subunit gpT family protein [Candidatus Peribacteraceae bacterium]
MSFANKVAKLKTFYQDCGTTEAERCGKFVQNMRDLLAEKDGKSKMVPEDFSIKEIYEAVHPSAFPIVTGELISKKVMKAYEMASGIGDQLVDTFKSNLMVDRIVGFSTGGTIEKVEKGGPYQHTGVIEEKWAQAIGSKYGKILDIHEETLLFDQTGNILRQAGKIGEDAAIYREKMIINMVQDIAGYYAWYVGSADGTATRTAIYGTGTTAPHRRSNQITNALVNHTDINAAVTLLGLQVDEKLDPIVVTPKILLVPVALQMVAMQVVGSTVILGGANAEPNPWAGKYKVLSSPYLDAQSSIAWYLGDFKKQFIWKEVIPLQVLTRRDDKNEAAWERDVKAQFKVRFYGDAKATDCPYVCKSTGAV